MALFRPIFEGMSVIEFYMLHLVLFFLFRVIVDLEVWVKILAV